ncbi:hypothetical protein EB233_02475 [Mesorhizobium erdmanii]|uniref:Uncharacterized protein n=1 Tax=Mesorhizobium erdmanii TaxID=1777866 RepID=A0A6M7UBC9_9HYPH|nr:hypothetical protein EB233_02475 [Mesorhizobium erdmanii]
MTKALRDLRQSSAGKSRRNARHFVIHGRSKERSDAAQTRGSMPGLLSAAAVQNIAPLHL